MQEDYVVFTYFSGWLGLNNQISLILVNISDTFKDYDVSFLFLVRQTA